MQRSFFLLFLILATSIRSSVFAQSEKSDDKKAKEFSIQAGLNWNNPLVDKDEFITGSKLGYQFGFAYMHGRHFWWQTGLHFYHMASSIVPIGGSDIGTISYSEIKVPVLFGLSLLPSTNEVSNIRAFAGVLPGFVVEKHIDNSFALSSNEFTGFHFDPTIGVDVDVLIVSARLGYGYGASNILKDYKSHPSYLYVYLGIGF